MSGVQFTESEKKVLCYRRGLHLQLVLRRNAERGNLQRLYVLPAFSYSEKKNAGAAGIFVNRSAISRPPQTVGLSEWLGIGLVANRFNVVPVWANYESCIVIRMIVRAQTRRAIVLATCF